MKSLKIACLGEAMIEMILDPDRMHAALGVAGDSMNTAIYLARSLGDKHEVSFGSMLGNDHLSDRIENFIRDEGVSTRLIKRHPEKLPGIYSIQTNEAGERSFSYWRDASAAREMFSAGNGLKFEQLDEFDVVFLSAISLAILPKSVRDQFFDWLEAFRLNKGVFVFDSNYRLALWTDEEEARLEVNRAWNHCDIALPSIDDEMALFGDHNENDILNRFREYGLTAGVLKRGELGPLPIGVTDIALPEFARAEKVIDTTAAGDSFNGGFLASYLTTGDLIGSMKAGHELANKVIGYRGAIMPL